ncbi:MAG: MinD/ParA family protein [Peptococcaceae bacterium]|nr:MinD/ParA family protein [Peptococcaceae bacterium]
MYDQVTKLRRLVREKDKVKVKLNNMRVIAVSSGKGGVGKTNLVVNLALALAEHKYKIIILDGDLGLANVDVAFGVIPDYNIRHLITGQKKIEDILYPVARGVTIFPGASGISELANLDRGQLENVLVNMGRLENMADILLIDTGAGLGHTVLNFISASDDVIVVLTPEPPAMTDAYGLIKAIKNMQTKVNVNVVVNMVENELEAQQTYERLEQAVKRFLGLPINLLGWIYKDPLVNRSVLNQKPVGFTNSRSPAYKCIQGIASNIMRNYLQTPAVNKGIRGFISSLLRIT